MADISEITLGGTTYQIKDSTARSQGGGSADRVSYDNTDSGLTATNVQDAIDELNTKIYDAGNYETVSLTIGSADSTFSPVGQTITVTLEDGSSTDYVLTNSLVISFSVQKGVRYTISGTSTADYRILPVSYVATLQTRLITMRYIPVATGVFILQSNGDYYPRQEYDAETLAEDAVGVLVLTSALINAGHGCVIKKTKEEANYNNSGGGGTTYYANKSSLTYSGLIITQRAAAAGKARAQYCYNKTLTMGDGSKLQGYLASNGEGKAIADNYTEVNLCLSLLGANPLQSAGLYASSNTDTADNMDSWAHTQIAWNTSAPHRPIYYYPIN